MEDIIKKIYYNMQNAEDAIYDESPEYQNLNDQVFEILEQLKGAVPVKEYQKISRLLEINTELGAIEVSEAFDFGFKCGASILLEIIKNK